MDPKIILVFCVLCVGQILAADLDPATLQDPFSLVERKNREVVLNFFEALFGQHDFTAIDKYIDPKLYIQHNPTVADGIEALRDAATNVWFKDPNIPPKKPVEFLHFGADGDLVWAQTKANLGDPRGDLSVMDIFKVRCGLIIEHWDIMQSTNTTDPPKNDHPFFSLPLTPIPIPVNQPAKTLDKAMVEAKNKKHVLDFYQVFFGDHEIEKADQYIDANEYIQHNPTVPDGLAAFKAAAQIWFKDAPKGKPDILRVGADEDLVWLHLKTLTPTGKPQATVDIFRLKNGKIVEHWDAHQERILEGAKNDHPLY